ncbi:cellulose biosynthesis protein BcsQ [Pseudomonas sp. ICMP 460]|uniref:cellulose biosynthesis protein BcsQ n=1 Tax=Pseudomonas sp. ICMP 460 TaxID=1718917 RepID=UPI002114B6FA|nr:cellulose biosynthesis protein BcsQ [Pseudomonas sp. ICMP 460]
MARAEHIAKLSAALGAHSSSLPCASDEFTAQPLQGLLHKLSQGEANHFHPPERVEGPRGEVYSNTQSPTVVVLVSATGGVGRSTLAAALASGLQRQGHPAFALDLDPQNALRHHLCPGFDLPGIGATSLLNQSWQALPQRGFAGCRVIAFGETDLAQQHSLNRWLGQDVEFLGKRLAGLGLTGQHTVFIDVPAGNTVYLRQAMSVADTVLVVVRPDAASFRRLAKMDEVLAPYCAGESPAQRFYVINQVDGGCAFSQDMAGVFRLHLGDAVLGEVHCDRAFSEAQAYGRDPLDPSLNSVGCQQVNALCRALMAQRRQSITSH